MKDIKKKKNVTICLTDDEISKIKKIADKEKRSMSQMIGILISKATLLISFLISLVGCSDKSNYIFEGELPSDVDSVDIIDSTFIYSGELPDSLSSLYILGKNVAWSCTVDLPSRLSRYCDDPTEWVPLDSLLKDVSLAIKNSKFIMP